MCAIVIHRLQVSWTVAFIDSAVTNLLLALISFGIINTNKVYAPQKGNHIYSAGYILVMALSVNLLAGWILSCDGLCQQPYQELLSESMPFRFVYSLLMISCMALLSGVRHYARDQEENILRKKEAEKLLKDAELAGLRQQLQPHFLFNSLNSISALAGSKPTEARRMIQQLSDFLRGTLKKDEQQLVTLADEIKHLSLYLEIEKVRFGHRLITDIKMEESCSGLQLPALLLQPVVENAIKFGLYDTTGEVTISIKATCVEGMMVIHVTNPYDSQTSGKNPGTGFGLTSVQRRLYLLYARQDLLETHATDNLFTTIIKIPQVI